jgi:hypothetical protein
MLSEKQRKRLNSLTGHASNILFEKLTDTIFVSVDPVTGSHRIQLIFESKILDVWVRKNSSIGALNGQTILKSNGEPVKRRPSRDTYLFDK